MASRSKHGPNRLSNYKNIHQTVMEQFLREDFVLSENLSFEDRGDGFLSLEGRIECIGNIYIEVIKRQKYVIGTSRIWTCSAETRLNHRIDLSARRPDAPARSSHIFEVGSTTRIRATGNHHDKE